MEETMGEEENIQTFREIIEALNAHDLDRFRLLIDKEHVMESDVLPESVHGLEATLETMQGYFNAFPDLHFDIEQVFASGDYVTLRWRATGTHQGELSGIPATNRSAEVHGCTVREFRDGKSTREWTYWDTGRLMQQLGVLPASQ
jgi:steroid delta-isomerase-like uncharacterized protein